MKQYVQKMLRLSVAPFTYLFFNYLAFIKIAKLRLITIKIEKITKIMKQLLLLFTISFLTVELSAQACMPNEMYTDSAVGVYPAPYNPDTNPEGGITESACIGSGYEFVLTFVIPSTININGWDVQLNSIEIAESGAVGGLPIGLSYDCNPGDCIFTPEDGIACMVIKGTATDVNTPGVYPLTIDTKIYTSLGDFNISFPTAAIPGADGEYNLTLLPNGDPNCTVAATNDYLTSNINVSNSPNPFGSTTIIEVNSKINETLQFKVFDMLGNLIHQREVEVFQGITNNIEFDGTALAVGIYNYSLATENAIISKKMVISR